MKSTVLYAATLATALFGASAAFASEATSFEIPPGTASRADVVQDLERAIAAGELSQPTELYGTFADTPAATRSRDDVRREARLEARSGRLSDLYIGS